MSGIFEYNGGSIVGMKGKNCIAVACDRRFGQQMSTITTNYQKVFKIQDNILLALSGLNTDIHTFYALMEKEINLYNLKENRKMKPTTFANLVASALYERRFGPFFVTPIVAGLENGKPILATYDSIGCKSDLDDFQVGGTGGNYIYGACEAFFKPDMSPEELEEVIGQSLVSGCDRDALSGWGGVVYVLTEQKITVKILKTKQT
ncbi:unnamed protein product [Paramecium sonneborni]|uniref:Proteasome subunit beta n=1 Tax=Paramecium sonneborni TaxID=65129 RepID=A0A8S1LNA0_9CILI|nr:unnamed protein product [Paramecium sonneborni]CAD8066823.1 unnamed protein product [Paramecium sonneborni]